jgi:hypothetical protein
MSTRSPSSSGPARRRVTPDVTRICARRLASAALSGSPDTAPHLEHRCALNSGLLREPNNPARSLVETPLAARSHTTRKARREEPIAATSVTAARHQQPDIIAIRRRGRSSRKAPTGGQGGPRRSVRRRAALSRCAPAPRPIRPRAEVHDAAGRRGSKTRLAARSSGDVALAAAGAVR